MHAQIGKGVALIRRIPCYLMRVRGVQVAEPHHRRALAPTSRVVDRVGSLAT
jgi:hypothetical protein